MKCTLKDRINLIEQLDPSNKTAVAICSFPDLIVLEANQNYLNFLNNSHNKIDNIIGRKLESIAGCYKESTLEKAFKNVIKNGKPYYVNEFNFKEEIYWDLSIVPVYTDEKIEYIIQTYVDVTERVLNRNIIEKQERVIKEQKQELESIVENMFDGVHIFDRNYKCSILNNSGKKIFYNEDLMKNSENVLKCTNYYDCEGNLIEEEDLPSRKAIKGERLKGYRLMCKKPDGVYYYDINSSPIYDKDGNIIKAIFCSHDITEQVKKDELIRYQKEKLEAIIENISDALVIFDGNGDFTIVNKAARNYLFYNKVLNNVKEVCEQVECTDIDGNLISSENLPAERVLKGEKLSPCKIFMKINNKRVNIELNGTPVYNKQGEFVAGIICFRDVTEKVKSEEDLLIKTQYGLLNRMVENLDLPVITLSYPDLKITHINQKAYKFISGLKPGIKSISSLKGKNYSDIITNFNKYMLLKHIKDIVNKKETSYLKYIRLIVDGEEVFVKKLYQPVLGLNGELAQVVVIFMDVTQEIEAKLKMEKTLKMHEQFLTNISHELKTPLNVIFSSAQLLELYLKNKSVEENKEKIIKDTYFIRQNCYRLIKLIGNIIDLSKIESGFFKLNLSNENIVSVVEDIVQSVSEYVESKDLSIIFDTDVEEKIIACDPDKIERVVLNLISNAIKFSDPGDEIYVNIADKNETVEISVKDNGIGIDKNHLNAIFERFNQVDKSFTRNAEGSGIGLCLVKSIVELHGGKISAESKLGEGSTFKIELPLRVIENEKSAAENKCNNKIEMINIEFSDIYSM
ncbi:histidine kinase [Clostridium carboxidivorans P7]|uniref:histidine kinase n=1 Tax=Clostridium carboxidivorans P7 TaxID=536227 RepID=C6PNN1_9CLOT|nr:PAS domain-containing sensor histidine kinase [Clostridium carboxidivorans]AKN32840.1 histidine kinase [Clostridium carboxidivorans P7]EET89158.1 PAS/PAC sensor signal transduction histidine kinase [Clostridium carboxidivorans P7]EFG89916.1 PAS domain S-box domain-containing protein [Clostridium carboxidivorans P7]